MPTYEYECNNGHLFEVEQRISDDPLERCQQCRAKARRLISATSFILKGGGWYSDGYSGGSNGGKGEKGDKGDKGDKGAKGGADSSSSPASGGTEGSGGSSSDSSGSGSKSEPKNASSTSS